MRIEGVLPALREAGQGPLVLAVSGGVDSMVLAALVHAAGVSPEQVTVAHFNHRLQENSDAVEKLVASYADKLGFRFVTERWVHSQGGHVSEAQARAARRAFLQKVVLGSGGQLLALAHQLDEQVETVLFRLARSGRASSVAGLRERNVDEKGIVWWRPLLGLTKRQLYAYADAHEIPFVEDPSNDEVLFTRNYVRHQVVPELLRVNAQLGAHVTRFTSELATLQLLAERTLKRLMPEPESDFDWARVAQEPRTVQALLLQRWLDAHGLSASSDAQSQMLDALLEAKGTKHFDLVGGRVATVYGRLALGKTLESAPALTLTAEMGFQPIPEGEIGVFATPPAGAQILARVPRGRRVELRHPRTDDSVQLANGQHQRLRRFWINHKVPRERRAVAWVAVSEGRIVWVTDAASGELFQAPQTDIIFDVLAFRPNLTKAGR